MNTGTMRLHINVGIDDPTGQSGNYGRLEFRQDIEIRAGSFEDVARIFSAFNDLLKKLKA